MPLSWNEIRVRAARFAKDWQDAEYEKGESQSFYNDFFEVFGNRRRNVAVYENKVQKLNDKQGFIDLFWPGVLLVEQKSAGRDLKKARDQATDYFISLSEKEKPRYILLSDFQSFELLDLENKEEYFFSLSELPENIRHFAFIAGYKQEKYKDQDPANIKASELMSSLHKLLEESGYVGHDLERLLVRIMFCLFAEDTGIFPMESFLRLIEDKTEEDGSDLGGWLIHLFDVLNTPEDKRQRTLDEDLDAFPYVNGQLFADLIRTPSFDSDMRKALLDCAYFDWAKVSPALFGSLFQTVMLPQEQRQGGAHYTSEKNILKVIYPLFLDELREEFEHIRALKRGKDQKLRDFQNKLASLTFFDPACGCGNFLILAFREIRQLELEVLIEILPTEKDGTVQKILNIEDLTRVNVSQFYGIEIEEFPARIAEAAMWLVDHQMNMKLSNYIGQAFVRLPLTQSAHIYFGNALKTNWDEVLAPEKCSYILGNPPFVGSKYMNKEQRKELLGVFNNIKGSATLDYVSAWHCKAAKYSKNTNIVTAFVSTNSICQGEQVNILWQHLMNTYDVSIHFAHRTFKWTIDEKKARGMRVAAVYVIIIGFAGYEVKNKYLYEYETLKSNPHKVKVSNINAYLVEGNNTFLKKRGKPICDVPEMMKGSQPTDGGYFLFNNQEKNNFLKDEPKAEKYLKRFVGGKEFINNLDRWCLWLRDAQPNDLRALPKVIEKVEKVKESRLKSKKAATRKWATKPTLFTEDRQPETNYLALPEVSSEKRIYIPIDFLGPNVVCSNKIQIVPNTTLFHFGCLTSMMHMSWVRYVTGRLKGDYQYSSSIVYNNFPWPNASTKDREKIADKAQGVLDARKEFPNSSLADLYDPNTMPLLLLKAHEALDKAVDQSYRKAAFKDEKERMEYLFERYLKLTEPLTKSERKAARSK